MTPGYEHRSREQEFKWVKSERELKELMTQKKVIYSLSSLSKCDFLYKKYNKYEWACPKDTEI